MVCYQVYTIHKIFFPVTWIKEIRGTRESNDGNTDTDTGTGTGTDTH